MDRGPVCLTSLIWPARGAGHVPPEDSADRVPGAVDG